MQARGSLTNGTFICRECGCWAGAHGHEQYYFSMRIYFFIGKLIMAWNWIVFFFFDSFFNFHRLNHFEFSGLNILWHSVRSIDRISLTGFLELTLRREIHWQQRLRCEFRWDMLWMIGLQRRRLKKYLIRSLKTHKSFPIKRLPNMFHIGRQ